MIQATPPSQPLTFGGANKSCPSCRKQFEVISPRDTYSEIEEKTLDWLRAGVRAVIVIDPRTESVRVHRVAGAITVAVPRTGRREQFLGTNGRTILPAPAFGARSGALPWPSGGGFTPPPDA